MVLVERLSLNDPPVDSGIQQQHELVALSTVILVGHAPLDNVMGDPDSRCHLVWLGKPSPGVGVDTVKANYLSKQTLDPREWTLSVEVFQAIVLQWFTQSDGYGEEQEGRDLQFVDFQIQQNGREHQTDAYRNKKLIIRRGKPFRMTLSMARGVYVDQLTFTAQTGPRKWNFPISQKEPGNVWGAVLRTSNSKTLDITFFTPTNAIIGLYSLSVQFSSEEEPVTLGKVILLFNPWHPGDAVFIEGEAERQEYVMNDYGIIFQGNLNYIQAFSWNYGQFEENIVDVCLSLLEHSFNFRGNPNADYSRRGDPAYVSRVISAMINSNDDNGVVEGKWDGEFTEGKKPTEWNGSVALLRQWQANGFKPVKYGQCWVFAGVLCTVMRCLGVPTRVVTNFESAHDGNGDLIIDQYFDKSGKHLKEESEDSIWNYHVWNECWMRRYDLSSFFNGWQVLDATPQELSDGIFCCGPTSVRAVKEKALKVKYDVPFVYAEVKATINSWVKTDDKKEKVNTNTTSVGRNISTKGVGANTRVDITNTYK
uniref:protein-glutamine gamma-glutamyltransferase n=1 Tax=Geotrypetes seraphini TaxID=260995 RepID=A0A6P8SVP1_GEOSA|nr:protein-glutamine gamma-glutamyltransferase 5-like [Geotrypetes seraphini]